MFLLNLHPVVDVVPPAVKRVEVAAMVRQEAVLAVVDSMEELNQDGADDGYGEDWYPLPYNPSTSSFAAFQEEILWGVSRCAHPVLSLSVHAPTGRVRVQRTGMYE